MVLRSFRETVNWLRSFLKPYRIRLVARNEALEYRDEIGIYWFTVSLKGGTWTVYLPCHKTERSNRDDPNQRKEHELDEEEQQRVMPRVTSYLSNLRWYRLSYEPQPVKIERHPELGKDYFIRLLEGDQVVEYEDNVGTCRFDVRRDGGFWNLWRPSATGTSEETQRQALAINRIALHMYGVRVVKRPDATPAGQA
jgi:hypothetical protein